jgi:dipeptide/tripeptide permease
MACVLIVMNVLFQVTVARSYSFLRVYIQRRKSLEKFTMVVKKTPEPLWNSIKIFIFHP